MKSKTTRHNSVFLAVQAVIPEKDRNSKPDAEDFVALRVREGDSTRPLFTPSMQTMNELIELGKMFTKWGVQETYAYIKTKVIPELEEMYQAGKSERYSVLIFNSPLLEEERQNEEIMLAINADRGPLTDIASCIRCGEAKVHKKMAQTRSADEGATSIFTCPRCGWGWNEG
jgi:DNA-directed RNA polymerase subunit M/transcription elongation factor TFIIS